MKSAIQLFESFIRTKRSFLFKRLLHPCLVQSGTELKFAESLIQKVHSFNKRTVSLKIITIALLFFLPGIKSVSAQGATQADASSEKFGNTLNLGVGIGYYGYIGRALPVVHADFEFSVAKNFTLAPFITYYSYQNYYYWGNPQHPHRNYSYRQTVMPIGVKGSYYFDQLLKAGSKWDFYLAASLGFAIRRTTWEDGYYGETIIHRGSSGLYLDGHIGTEYHMNAKTGLFLDLSSGISTFGLALHL